MKCAGATSEPSQSKLTGNGEVATKNARNYSKPKIVHLRCAIAALGFLSPLNISQMFSPPSLNKKLAKLIVAKLCCDKDV